MDVVKRRPCLAVDSDAGARFLSRDKLTHYFVQERLFLLPLLWLGAPDVLLAQGVLLGLMTATAGDSCQMQHPQRQGDLGWACPM